MKKILINRYRNVILLTIILLSVALNANDSNSKRPLKWATPVKSENLHNLYKINSDIYRSEQPDEKAFAELKKLGIKSVLNLRMEHTDKNKVKGYNFNLYKVGMNSVILTDKEVVKALKYIDEAPKPVLIHCMHGSDRTGLVCAMYRVICQGWSKKDAIDELKNGGYGFHQFYQNIVNYINYVDVAKIRRKLDKKLDK